MNITETAIPDVKIIEPKVFTDARGYFFESWNRDAFKAAGIDCNWVQDNESKSRFGVLRGLHYQAAPYTQAKLVRVIQGAVLYVAVDIRQGSPTFGKHIAVELSSENKRQLFVPRGFAHGFAVLSEEAIFQYKCDNYYNKESEGSVAWNDLQLGIDWRITAEKVILSEKDKLSKTVADADYLFDYNEKLY